MAASSAPPPRKLLLPVDDSDECEQMVAWVAQHLYKRGDEVHLMHVIPRIQQAQVYGTPPVDFAPPQSPEAYQSLVEATEGFVARRFLSKLPHGEGLPPPVVHIVKGEVDADSIGACIEKKADDLPAAAVAVAAHSKSRLERFFVGSVASHLIHHCKRPVVICH